MPKFTSNPNSVAPIPVAAATTSHPVNLVTQGENSSVYSSATNLNSNGNNVIHYYPGTISGVIPAGRLYS